jgi:class 3 adenylate cyclase
MTCSSCGAENRAGRKFCSNCGFALAIACPACGAANEPEDRFCGDCGAALSGAQTAARPTHAEAHHDDHVGGVRSSPSERRLVSVLFTDLVGFTPLSESRDAEEVREFLSHYFDEARRIVDRYGGSIEKFIGDAVMAVWGSPVAREDDAERAVRAGLELVSAVEAIGADEGVEGLAARGGVATGEALVDREAQNQGMVIGDLVNTASRVQTAAAPGSVYVTDATKRASEAAVAYDDAGDHELKGKTEPLRLYRASRIVAGRGGSLRAAGLEAPFVGRDRELRLLKGLFHASAEGGAAHLVAVTGIGGIGKSRLAWEFEKYLDGLVEDVWWHRGRCLPYGDGVAYWALAEMVRSRLGAAEEEEPATTLGKLRAWLETHCEQAQDRRWLEAQLGQLLALGERETAPREELFAAWRRFFELLAEQGPVAMVFEDLQWADSGLLDFIDELLERGADLPLYVVALARPEIADRRPGWGAGRTGWTSITLQPLADEQIAQMLRGMVPGIPEDLVTRIGARAEGIPLYAVETVRMLLDRGVVRRTDEGVELAPGAEGGDLDIPETLQALIGARLDGLPDEERALLQHASVLGKTFALPMLAALTGSSETELRPMVTDLVHKEMLAAIDDAPDRGQFGFLQSIVQRVIYETVSRHDRKARHLVVARHLETTWAGDEDDIAEVVAAHYLEAYEAAPTDPDAGEIRHAARTALERAGRRAQSLAASAEAVAYFDRAAALAENDLERARLAELAGTALWMAGDPEPVIERLDGVIAEYERLDRPADAARASAKVAEAYWISNRVEEGVRRMESAYVATRGQRDRDTAWLCAQLGRFRYFSASDESTLQRAYGPIEEALGIAESLWLPDILSEAMNTKGLILGSLSRPEEGLALLERALSVALENDATYAAIRAFTNLSNEMWQRDRLADAFVYVERGQALAERAGYRGSWWFLQQHRSSHLEWRGDWDGLEALWQEFDARRDEPGAGAGAGTIDATWISVLAEGRGDVARAEALAERYRSMEGSDDFQLRAFAEMLLAQVAAASGRPEEALSRARGVVEAHEILGARAWIFKNSMELAFELSLELRDLDAARAVMAEIDALPRGVRTPLVDAAISGYGARISVATGGGAPEAIEAGFRQAEHLLREIDRRFGLARFQLHHAEWLASEGRPGEAIELAAEAGETFRRLRATPWLERAEAIAGVSEPAPS